MIRCPRPPCHPWLIHQYLTLSSHLWPHSKWGASLTNSSSVQLLNYVRLFAVPWTATHQASLSITNSQSLPKLMSVIELAIGMLMMSMFQNTFYLNPFTTFVGNLLISSRHAEQGFPVSSAGEESSCKKETPSSIPESGSSPREEDGTHSSIPAWRIP